MRQPKKPNLNRWKRETKQWLQTSRQVLFESPLAEIEAALGEGGQAVCKFAVQISVGQVARWSEMLGGMSVVEGDPSGWSNIHKAMALRAFSARVLAFRKTPFGVAQSLALVLVYGLAVGDEALARSMGETICRAVREGLVSDYNQIGFEPFSLWLLSQAVGGEWAASFRAPEYGDAYAGIVKHWDDNLALGGALATALDAHIEHAIGRTGDDYAQFPEPFDICPVEVVAVQRVRQRLSLPVPTVDHILITWPMANLPTSPPPFPDNLVERLRSSVAAKVEKVSEVEKVSGTVSEGTSDN